MSCDVKLYALRRAIFALLSSLVLMQSVGMLHRVLHVQSTHSSVASHHTGPAIFATDSNAGLQLLWGNHSNAVDCQLFDQCCPDLLHTAVMAAQPIRSSLIWFVFTLHERFALFERFYAARGPPVVLL